VFDDMPEVAGIGWTQYTPYFMDGEPCEFSVNDFWPIWSKEVWRKHRKPRDGEDFVLEDEGNEYYDELYEEYASTRGWHLDDANSELDIPDVFEKKFHSAISLFGQIPDDVYNDMFGDHVAVTATRDKIETEEWGHD
jgi:hypothetical protein